MDYEALPEQRDRSQEWRNTLLWAVSVVALGLAISALTLALIERGKSDPAPPPPAPVPGPAPAPLSPPPPPTPEAFMSVDLGGPAFFVTTQPVVFAVVNNDTLGMYNSTSGNVTIPFSGFWAYTTSVLLSQSNMPEMTGATFYQHLLFMFKSTPFSNGDAFRAVDTWQDRLNTTTPLVPHQVHLRGTETVYMSAGDTLYITMVSAVFAPVTNTNVTNAISGCCGFNMLSLRYVGA